MATFKGDFKKEFVKAAEKKVRLAAESVATPEELENANYTFNLGRATVTVDGVSDEVQEKILAEIARLSKKS